MTIIHTMRLKLNSLIKVQRTNLFISYYSNINLLLEDIQDPENPNDTNKNQIHEVRSIFVHSTKVETFKTKPLEYSKKMHCVWISVIAIFPLIYCGLYFAIKYTIITETEAAQQAFPDIVRVSSSGPAGELYPDSLGDYRLTEIIHNDLPVYQHSARDDRYIIGNGNYS